MSTETVVIENTTGSADYFEIGDASHDHIHYNYTEQVNTQQVRIQDMKPVASDAGVRLGPRGRLANGPFFGLARITNPNNKVWLKINNNSSVTVIRGDALLDLV